MAKIDQDTQIYQLCCEIAEDPGRKNKHKGILIPLGEDRSIDIANAEPGISAEDFHRNGLYMLHWRPHLDFTAAADIPCPRCKRLGRVSYLKPDQGDNPQRYLRVAAHHDRTILVLGCSYRCSCCGKESRAVNTAAKAAALAAGQQYKQKRSNKDTDQGTRSTWVSWDQELLNVLPAAVAAQFPLVMSSGCAVHKQLFDDMLREVAAGRRSFSEYSRSLMMHQKQLFYKTLLQYLDYNIRVVKQSSQRLGFSGNMSAKQDAPAAAAGSAPTAAAAPPSQLASAAADELQPEAAAAAEGVQTLVRAEQQLQHLQQQTQQQQQQKAAKPKGAATKHRQTTLTHLRLAPSKASTPTATGSSKSSAAAAASASTRAKHAAASTVPSCTVPAAPPCAASVMAPAPQNPAADTAKAASTAAAKAGSSSSKQGGKEEGSKKRKHSDLSQCGGFGSFEDIEGWCGYVPSEDSLIDLFITHSKQAVLTATYKQLKVGGRIFRVDHNYKFVKCVRKDGKMVYDAVFTIMNEDNKIVAQYLTEDSSWDTLVPYMQQLEKRLTAQNLPTPSIVYTDNTKSSENSILAALPAVEYVLEDTFHAGKRVTSTIPDDVAQKSAIMGMVKNALLPIWPEDKTALREHCTKHWLDSAGKKHDPMMSVKEYKEKPVSFLHKYCRHYTPEPAEQERLLRDIPRTMAHLVDPSTGLEVFREDGPTMKALENLIELVQAGKLQDPMPTPQMYRNDPFAVKGKLTVPQSLRSTSQLEGYHGASLNHVLAGYNVSAQVAVPQLTLTNDSWNTEREVTAGITPQYHCHDTLLLQRISDALKKLGHEALRGVGSDLMAFMRAGRLDISALEQELQGMTFVDAAVGVLPETLQDAEDLQKAAGLQEEVQDFLAADWYNHQQQHPQQQQPQPARSIPTPVAPWAAGDTAAEHAETPDAQPAANPTVDGTNLSSAAAAATNGSVLDCSRMTSTAAPDITRRSTPAAAPAQEAADADAATSNAARAAPAADAPPTAAPTAAAAAAGYVPGASNTTGYVGGASAGSGMFRPGMLGSNVLAGGPFLLGNQALAPGVIRPQVQLVGQLMTTAQGQQVLVPNLQAAAIPGLQQQPRLMPGQVFSSQLITAPVAAALLGQGLVAVPRGDGSSVLVAQQWLQQQQQHGVRSAQQQQGTAAGSAPAAAHAQQQQQ